MECEIKLSLVRQSQFFSIFPLKEGGLEFEQLSLTESRENARQRNS